MAQHSAHRGARLGTRVAHIVTQAMVSTHRSLLDTKRKLAMVVFNEMSNEISDEVDATIGHILVGMAEAYERDGAAAGMLHFMAHGRGQMKALSGSSVAASSLTWALSAIINNELAPLVYEGVAAKPQQLPDANTLALFAATGRMLQKDAVYGIAANGYEGQFSKAMIDASYSYPNVSDALDMYRKALITQETFFEYMTKNAVPADAAQLYLQLVNQPVSAQDAAVAYLRGAISSDQMRSLAEVNGWSAYDLQVYLDSIGEPPGVVELLEAERRGFIDTETLRKGILQSRVRDEWIPVLQALAYSPMSIADAVNGAVQGHLPYDAAASIANQNGLEPGAFDVLYQTAGSPLSRTELNDLFNRGVITSDQVKQGLRESRLKDKYVDVAFELRRRMIEPRELGAMVRNGVLSHETAVEYAMASGFTAEDATLIVDSNVSSKLQGYRDRIVSSIETLYMDNAITQQQARELIVSMNYTGTEADFILSAAEYHREARSFSTAVNAVRSKYVGRHIDRGEASSLLDAMGMPSTQREYLLGLWQVEEVANVRSLTPKQIVDAVGLNMIDQTDGKSRLMTLGYSSGDADMLLNGL